MNCIFCNANKVITEIKSQTFPYRKSKAEKVDISVQLPVRVCKECNQMWTDFESESVKEKAIMDYELSN